MSLRLPALALLLLLPAAGCARVAPVTRIVLVTWDTTRVDRIGCYGGGGLTPNLDSLASEAVVFDQALSPAPTTLPSHTSMMSGVYPQDHGVRYNLFYVVRPEERMLAELLADAGYTTAGFPGAMVVGRDFGIAQGFETFVEPADLRPEAATRATPGAERSAEEGVEAAFEWLDTLAPEQKAFLWLHFYDPHWPYDPPFPYSAEYRERTYDGEIAYTDAQFGRLIDRLRADPEWDRTLLVVAADHGEGLYDHRERWHHLLAYQTTQHVPLVIRAPGARARRESEAVTLADIAPTVLDLAGVDAGRPLRGISLRPALTGAALPPRDLYVESLAGTLIYGWAEIHGIRSGRWKLLDSPRPELYDLRADPGETENLASLEAERVGELRAALETLKVSLQGSAATEGAAKTPQLDAGTREMLESLGYVGGGGGSAAEGAPHPQEFIDMEPELLAAQQGISQGRWVEVEELCRYALGRDPTNKWALAQITRALVRLDRSDEAQEHGEALVGLYPDMEDAYVVLAQVHRAAGRAEEAHAQLVRGVEQLPDSEMLSYLSLVAAFDAGRDDVCRKSVPTALGQYPRSARLTLLRARCEARAGEAERALSTLEAVVRLGFDRFDGLETEADFAEVVALPGYAELKASLEDG